MIPEVLRALVVERARDRCEYCRVPSKGQIARFPIDHILPRTEGGATDAGNLALACPSCNAHKWAHRDGVDPETGLIVRLFHPRIEVWSDHFRWSASSPFELEGLTPSGRATIDRLRMNDVEIVEIRRLLAALGLLPEDMR